MNHQYILNEKGDPILEPDLLKWAKWFEKADRNVFNEMVGESNISTIFLGLDHSFLGGNPILWETMVFGGKFDQDQDRCSGSRKNAEKMHKRMVKKVKNEDYDEKEL